MRKYQYFSLELSNGLKILYLPVKTAESVFVSLIGKVGRRAEESNEVGAAHFLEHLFFDGTQKRPNALRLSQFLEYHGGEHNGFTSAEVVEYFVKILPDKAEVAFDYLSDTFFNSLLKEIEKERKVIVQEAAASRDNPAEVLRRLSLTNLYPGQSIGRTIFDEEPNLKNINETLLRDYMDRSYVAENFVLSIAGNINRDKAISLAEKYFTNFKKGKEVFFEKARIREKGTIEITHKDLTQAKLSINFRGFEMNSYEATVAQLLSIIIGGGMSSRLFNKLRNEKHLVYRVGSFYHRFSDTGYFSIQTFVAEDNLQRATNEIFAEVKKLLDYGITDEELEKAKNIFLTGFLFRMEEIESYVSFFNSQYLLKGRIKEVEERIEEVKRTTKKDILKIAKFIFSDNPKVNVLTKSLEKLEIS
jgi:predicted Zn-dependent peptidase